MCLSSHPYKKPSIDHQRKAQNMSLDILFVYNGPNQIKR